MTQQQIKDKMSQTSDFSTDMQLQNIFVDYISGTDTGPGTWQENVELKTHFFNEPMKLICHTTLLTIFKGNVNPWQGKGWNRIKSNQVSSKDFLFFVLQASSTTNQCFSWDPQM